jgi:DNA-binding beta-propeller fold protein YncE
MSQILKHGTNIFKSGNYVFRRPSIGSQLGLYLTMTGLSQPWSCAVDSKYSRIFFNNRISGKVGYVSLTDISNPAAYSFISGIGTWAVAVDTLYDRLFVLNSNTASYIPLSNLATAPVTFGNFLTPQDSAFDYVNNRLFISNRTGNTVTVYTLSTLSVLGSITQAQGGFSSPWGMKVIGSYLYVVNNGNSTLSIIPLSNITAYSSIITTAQGGFSDPGGIGYNKGTGKIYVCNPTPKTISVLSTSNLTGGYETIDSTTGNFNAPYGIDVDPLTGQIFIVNQGSNTISVLRSVYT